MRLHVVPLAVLLPLAGCVAAPHERAAASAQRPSFSSDTATTAEGTFEVEAGVVRDDESSFDSPVSLKLGTGPRTELFLDVSPYQRAEGGGETDEGLSDVVVGARHRLHDGTDGTPSTALQLSAKLPVSGEADQLSSGEVDLFGAGILTGASGALTWTGFYQLGLLGDPGDAGLVVEHGLALAAAHPLTNEDVSAFCEVATLLRPEWDEQESFTTFGLALTPRPDLILDVFGVVGLSSDATDAAIGLGLTRNLGGVGFLGRRDRAAPPAPE